MANFAPIVSALLAFASLGLIILLRLGNKVQDIPNERSLHSAPVPRVGGVGLFVGIASGFAMMHTALFWWWWLPLALLLFVSFLDDVYGLSVSWRLAVHLAAAVILVFGSGFATRNGIVMASVLLLFTVWMTNLYNFMDGSDGLAGGMALFGFASFGVAGLLVQDEVLAGLNLTIAAAAFSFLLFNFNPARIFMGDVGAIPLGFLVAAMGAWGWQRGAWEFWFPLLVFSPFIMDASVTLIKRWMRGMRITEAHRDHYYQRAVRMGHGHKKVAIAEYVLMAATGGSALWASQHGGAGKVLLAWLLAYAVIMVLLDNSWKKCGSDIR